MKKLLFVLTLFVFATPSFAAHREVYNVHTGRLDKVGVSDASKDMTVTSCANGEILKYNGSVWACASDATAAGGAGNDVIVSEDGVTIATSSTDNLKVNYTSGFEVIQNSVVDATVSMDFATVTAPGIASFDTSHFTVTPGGYVDLKVPSQDTFVLYNDNDVVSADPGFVWDNTTAQLGVGDGDFQGDVNTDGADLIVTRNQNQPWINLRGAWSTADAAPLYDMYFSRGTLTAPSALASGDDVGYFSMYGYDSNSWDLAATMAATVGGGAVSTASVPVNFVIQVNDKSGSSSTGPFELSSSGSHDLFGKLDMLDANWAVSDDDCTGEQGHFWYDTGDSQFEFCNGNSGTPKQVPTGGGWDVRTSHDSVSVATSSSDNLTINYTTGLSATGSGASATVSTDIATATTPGIASFDSTNFTVHPGGRVYIKDQGVTGDEIVNDTLDFTEFGDTMTLDANTTIATSNLELTFQCNNPGAGCFDFNGTGAYTGDLLHIHQHTGNAGAGNLLHIEAVDMDVDPLVHITQDAADITEDTVLLLLDAVDDDDANYIPFEIRDDEDVNDDLLVRINYRGDIFTNSGVSADIVSVDSVLAIWDSDNSHHTFFRGANQSTDNNYVLPISDGTENQVLHTDGNGVLSWGPDDTGAGTGDNVTVNAGAVDTTANLLDGDIDWTLVDGGAGGPDDITGTVECDGCVSSGDIATNGVGTAEMADADHGDVSWSNHVATVDSGAIALDELSDVAAAAPNDADLLIYESSPDTRWENKTMSGDCTIDNTGAISCFGGAISDTNMDAENFGDWTCTGDEDGCTINTGAVSADEVATDAINIAEIDDGPDTPADGETLVYDMAGSGFRWQSCAEFTGSADLCDGDDATGGGGGSANVDARVSFDKVFSVQTAKLPGSSPAQIDAGEPGWRLLYDASDPEMASFDTVLTPYQGGPVSAEVFYTMSSATSNKLCFGLKVACVTPSDTEDIQGGWGYDTINSADKTVPGTAGYLDVLGFQLSNDDSCTTGDMLFVEAKRVADNAEDDTATGDAEIRKIRIYEV